MISILSIKHNRQSLRLEADAILSATGRDPNTQSLCCDKAGVELDIRGAVIVNDKLQSNVSHIYALGDVNGGAQFTYVLLVKICLLCVIPLILGIMSFAPVLMKICSLSMNISSFSPCIVSFTIVSL